MRNKLNIKLVLNLILAVLFSGAYFYFLQILESNRVETIDLRDKSQTLKLKLSDLHVIENNLKSTVESGDKISNLFLRQDSIVNFIQVIENLIKGSGIVGSVDSVVEHTNPTLDAMNKEKINIVISTHGDWSELIGLLGLFERLPYKSTVNSFSLRYDDMKSESREPKSDQSLKVWNLRVMLDVWAINNKNNIKESNNTIKEAAVNNEDSI